MKNLKKHDKFFKEEVTRVTTTKKTNIKNKRQEIQISPDMGDKDEEPKT